MKTVSWIIIVILVLLGIWWFVGNRNDIEIDNGALPAGAAENSQSSQSGNDSLDLGPFEDKG